MSSADLRDIFLTSGAAEATQAAADAADGRLQLDSVSLSYAGTGRIAQPVLQRMSLELASGEHAVLVGPSGAGKTTLLHAAALALRPQAGRVLLGGQDAWCGGRHRLRRLRRRLFLAPQVPPLPPRQRVVTAVLAGRLPAMTLAQSVRSLLLPLDIQAAYDALVRFELGDRLFERVDRLSGGERQRVSLARALLAPARLWLLDEPLSALDPARAAAALRVVREQAAARGVTLLVSMHQIDLALASFPRVIGLRDGVMCFDCPATQVTAEQLARLYASELAAPDGQHAAGAELALPSPRLVWR